MTPQVLAKKEAEKQADNQGLIEARRSFKDMIYGTPVDGSDEYMPDGFITEMRPGQRYLVDIRNKCEVLLVDLLDQPLHSISAEQVKTVYLQKVGRGKTQLDGAMRILRSIWNWAQTKYDDSNLFIRNPVSRAMKQLGVNINRTNRCTGRLDDADFKPYLESVLNLREHDHTSAYRNGRDALLFMLFSGVRRTGTMTVRMEGIDLDRLVFKIIKKGGDQVELPLSQTILTSELYEAKSGAVNGIESVRNNSPSDSNYDRRTSKREEPYFVLKAGNGQIIGTSEMYSSTAAMENGIQSVKTNGPTAPVEDNT